MVLRLTPSQAHWVDVAVAVTRAMCSRRDHCVAVTIVYQHAIQMLTDILYLLHADSFAKANHIYLLSADVVGVSLRGP